VASSHASDDIISREAALRRPSVTAVWSLAVTRNPFLPTVPKWGQSLSGSLALRVPESPKLEIVG